MPPFLLRIRLLRGRCQHFSALPDFRKSPPVQKDGLPVHRMFPVIAIQFGTATDLEELHFPAATYFVRRVLRKFASA